LSAPRCVSKIWVRRMIASTACISRFTGEDTALTYVRLLEQEGDPAEARVVGWALVLTPAAHIGQGFIA
jgi:hypothetical protein